MNNFEATRAIEKQLKAKLPTLSEQDVRLLAEMSIKFSDDFSDLVARTLSAWSPLMDEGTSAVVAALCLADTAGIQAEELRNATTGAVRELRAAIERARKGGGGLDTVLAELLKKKD